MVRIIEVVVLLFLSTVLPARAFGIERVLFEDDQSSQEKEIHSFVSEAISDSVKVPSIATLNRFSLRASINQSSQAASDWMVLFCPPWWGPCQKIWPPFQHFGRRWQTELNQGWMRNDVRFAVVDCATDKLLCNEEGVIDYPWINHYHLGDLHRVWVGGSDNDEETLDAWLEQELKSPKNKAQPSEGFMHDVFRKKAGLDVLLAFIGVAASLKLVLSNRDL